MSIRADLAPDVGAGAPLFTIIMAARSYHERPRYFFFAVGLMPVFVKKTDSERRMYRECPLKME